MVHGGCFTPGGEGVIPFRHGPPHAARARKIGGGPGVIDAALVGGGDSALNVQHRAANIEMGARQRLNGGISVGLHPFLQRLGAVQGTHRVHIQQLFGTFYAGARFDL